MRIDDGFQIHLHEQVIGHALQFGTEVFQVQGVGKGESGLGLKEGFSGHGRAAAVGGQFLDVDAQGGEGGGDLTDDAGAVLADQLQLDQSGGRGGGGIVGSKGDGEAFGGQGLEGGAEVGGVRIGDGDAEDAGEFAAQPAHAAFEPVAALLGDQVGEAFDQAGAIPTDDGKHEGALHGGSPKGAEGIRKGWGTVDGNRGGARRWGRYTVGAMTTTTLGAAGVVRPRLPEWLRLKLPVSDSFSKTRHLLQDLKLHTVCESAKCPNHWECWGRGTATFMIGGDRCTRACGFCAVSTAKPMALEVDEPQRVAEATRRMGLKHVVITAVARDDLADGGAEHFRKTVEAVRGLNPGIVVEILTPDFLDRDAALEEIWKAQPDIFNHNLETVRRLTPTVRHRATYDRSLSVLGKARARSEGRWRTKSGMMLGLGETTEEVLEALRDLRSVGCDLLTLGQYLQPTLRHLPVVEFVTPERFAWWAEQAEAMGFGHVSSGPLVRSSYHADEVTWPGSE